MKTQTSVSLRALPPSVDFVSCFQVLPFQWTTPWSPKYQTSVALSTDRLLTAPGRVRISTHFVPDHSYSLEFPTILSQLAKTRPSLAAAATFTRQAWPGNATCFQVVALVRR